MTFHMPSQPRLHRLDHLRAIAALMVLVWHCSNEWGRPANTPSFPVWSLFLEGHTGVSLFCVISGFIFTHLYFKADLQYQAFMAKRILRIMPLFVVVVALSFYVSTWSLSDLALMFATGLVRGGLPSFAGPGWSVLIEFQFYLLFPFLLVFVRNYGPGYLLAVVGAFLMLRGLMFLNRGVAHDIAYYSIFGRIDQFAFGMFAARLLDAPTVKARLSRPGFTWALFLGALAIISIFYRWFAAHGGLLAFRGVPYPSTSALWVFMPTIEAVCYAAILLGYLHLPALRWTRWLSRVFAYIGLVSYSIYLVHLMVAKAISAELAKRGMMPTTWQESLLTFFLLALPAFVAVASVTYFVIERPFLQLKKRTKGEMVLAGP